MPREGQRLILGMGMDQQKIFAEMMLELLTKVSGWGSEAVSISYFKEGKSKNKDKKVIGIIQCGKDGSEHSRYKPE